jgi:DNA-binding GntR family transcriptional regulator
VLRALVAKLDAIIGREDEAISHEAWYQVNARFHRLLIQLTGNEQLLKLYDGLNLDGRILRVITGWGLSPLPEALRESQRHHREMLEAVEARDVAALQDVLRIHIQHGIQRALSTLRMMGGVL